jgi:hypothetical protein
VYSCIILGVKKKDDPMQQAAASHIKAAATLPHQPVWALKHL